MTITTQKKTSNIGGFLKLDSKQQELQMVMIISNYYESKNIKIED